MMITTQVGEPVLDQLTLEPIMTVAGVPILGLGRWRAHGSLINYRSAISRLTKNRVTQSTEYKKACPDCIAKWAAGPSHSMSFNSKQ
jgi:hypothetical protein